MDTTEALTTAAPKLVPLCRVMKYHLGTAGKGPTINFATPQFDPPPPPLHQTVSRNLSPPGANSSATQRPSALASHLGRNDVGDTAPVYAPVVSEVTPNQRPPSVASTPLNLPSIAASPLRLPQSGGGKEASTMQTPSCTNAQRTTTTTSTDGSFDGDRALAPCLLGLSTPSLEAGQLLDNAASPSVVSDTFPPVAHARSASSSSSVLPPHSELAMIDSKKAVVLFVSASARDCLLATRFFCTRITHFLAWGGDCARMFTLGKDEDSLHWFNETPKERWREALSSLAASVTEYLGMQHVLGLAATPTAIILGDFAQEAALGAAEKDMMTAWELLPGVRTTRQNISFRYIRFAERWISDLPEMGDGVANVARRSHVEVNLSIETMRSTLSTSGVVCAMVVGYLVQVLPIICHVHRYEPRTGSSKGTMQSLPPLFFTRHGQSKYNIEDRLGGNPELTTAGVDDALSIGKFFEEEVSSNPYLFGGMTERWKDEEGFEVWCSQLQRTKSTAQPTADKLTNGVVRMWSSLNEIHAGVCEDMTNEEVMGTFPSLHQFRKLNKVAFRYPSGESYLDLMIRLKPVLLALDTSKKCVVVVAHQAVLRTLLSYFGGRPVEEAVTSECPHRTVWCCSFDKAGCARLATISLPESDRAEVWQGI